MIAYFCTEYELDEKLKTYAGGLGILAGDTIRQAGDEGRDFVGIGLYYYKGYLSTGYEWFIPEACDLELVRAADGTPLNILVPIGDREVSIRAWCYRYKTARVYLLDAMQHHNHPDDQKISYHLYDQDITMRVAQQMILGIGGMRLLKALNITPHIYHMNEGHSTFLHLEALAGVPIMFTNHTVIPEGNQMYSADHMRKAFAKYQAQNPNFNMQEFLERGSCQYENTFSMMYYAIRVCQKMNGVSALHTRKLKQQHPGIPIQSVTNGIHVPTWDMLGQSADSDIVAAHAARKKELLTLIKEKSGVEWSPDVLLLGWGRRFVQYKRPMALFEDAVRLINILKSTTVPMRIVLSGIPHPADQWANETLSKLLSQISDTYKDLAVYIPGYNPEIAKRMTSGCDVWMNTPTVGLEACGTSGMKASLNGTLAFSTPDGWMAEVDMKSIGWEIEDMHVSDSIYATLEQQIVPEWTAYKNGSSKVWQDKMVASRKMIIDHYSAKRMMVDYDQLMWK
ncbi:MAG: alpha-glucan family phosphorylase [Candidatus Roizmanbacteria bacterium]